MLSTMIKASSSVPPFDGFFVPIILSNATNSFVFLIGTDGGILGRIQLPARFTEGVVNYQRYNDQLYVLIGGSSSIYRCNLNTLTASTISSGSENFGSYWVRFNQSTLLQVRTAADEYKVLNMSTGSITTTAYDSTTTAVSGGRGAVSFYDKTSSGLSNFGSRVYWQGTKDSGSPFNGETNTATVSSGALNTRSIVLNSSPSNYSRGWSAIGNSSTAMLGSVFGGPWKVSSTSASASAWTLSNAFISYDGNTYSWQKEQESPCVPRCLTSGLQMYDSFTYYDSGLGGSRYIIGKFDFSASTNTQSATRVLSLPFGGSTSSISCTITQINDSGHIAILYQDATANNNTIVLNIVNGTTVTSTTSINVTSTYSTVRTNFVNASVSELEFHQA